MSLDLFLQIASVTLELGSDLVAYLRCEGATSEDLVTTRIEFPSFKAGGLRDVFVLNAAEMRPRNASVDLAVVHEPPALRGECYPLRIELASREGDTIRNVRLVVTAGNGAFVHDQPKIDRQTSVHLTTEAVAVGEVAKWNIFSQMEHPGKYYLHFQVDRLLCF